jgi:nucleotidyltransferase/DNA polymerase involved in DNA repair
MEKSGQLLIVHVDMDAFYASIEQMDKPEYNNKPVVVGADPRGGKGRGVVSAASYEAREYGIHSAMPISRAYRLCPGAVFVRPRMLRYREISKQVMEILYEFSPLVEQISVDEAFLDCSGTGRLIGPAETIGRSIKKRILQETSLTASVGIASNKSIAKIASEIGKPNGLTVCPLGKEKEFIKDLPLKYLWGAGKKTIENLNNLGYTTIGEVASGSQAALEKIFGKHGLNLWRLANGIDNRPVQTGSARKSISEETTFVEDVDSDVYIEHVLFKIADRLTRHMRTLGIKGRTVSIKIRLQDFETFTRSRTLDGPVNDMQTIRKTALELYRQFSRKERKVRLVGISVANLDTSAQKPAEQFELFQDETVQDNEKDDGNREAFKSKVMDREKDELLDKMKRIYGEKITRAAFIKSPSDKESRKT